MGKRGECPYQRPVNFALPSPWALLVCSYRGAIPNHTIVSSQTKIKDRHSNHQTSLAASLCGVKSDFFQAAASLDEVCGFITHFTSDTSFSICCMRIFLVEFCH